MNFIYGFNHSLNGFCVDSLSGDFIVMGIDWKYLVGSFAVGVGVDDDDDDEEYSIIAIIVLLGYFVAFAVLFYPYAVLIVNSITLSLHIHALTITYLN